MRLLVLFLAITAAACGSGGNAPTPDADEALACQASGRGDNYVAGLERMGTHGLLDFKLVSATPAPPGRFLNSWMLQINTMSGGVVGGAATGATMTVTPYMPDHQHGAGAYIVHVQEMSGGQYQLTEINLSMPGYWEITIDAQSGAAHDTVVFKFCVQA